MSTWHQDKARRRAYEAGRPVELNHPTLWTVRTDAPNRGASSMTWLTQEDALNYLSRLKALADANPDDIERQLEAKYSYILPPRSSGAADGEPEQM